MSAPFRAPGPIQVLPRFHEIGGRRIFAVEWRPTAACRGTVVYLPPWAEEMNRCRTLVADTARALAGDGWRCVVTDPHATGESEGTSDEADWGQWVNDTVALLRQLQPSDGPTVLWGLRTGALLAAEVAATAPEQVASLLLWQPVLDGSLFLNQTLRLRIASQMVHAGDKETTDGLRRRLAGGETLEIAGYPLTGRLAEALDGLKMSAFASRIPQPVLWVEVVPKPGATPSPASRKLIESWPTAIRVRAVDGPMVWQVHDREQSPALVQATRELLANEGA